MRKEKELFYIIGKDFEISSSHRLINPKLSLKENKEVFGKCFNEDGHGHNYIIRLELKSQNLENGMIMNFNKVKDIFNKYINDVYDHHNLNKIMKDIPTAENMCREFWGILKPKIPKLYSITIWETRTSFAKIVEEESLKSDFDN